MFRLLAQNPPQKDPNNSANLLYLFGAFGLKVALFR
ncbi:NUDIX hydrolase [Listeria monocytogenes]|nr:NUDIX hydrolase [Listeria monocytogenes]GAT39380.1 NUDIX hydrolase [Listeria monocytogenes]GAT41723.1 NUDIX hydrolase [Listeria monocytogenes]